MDHPETILRKQSQMTISMEPDIEVFSEPATDNVSYGRTKRCVLVALAVALLAGLIYAATQNVMVAGAMLLTAVVPLSLFHPPFGLCVMYFLLPVESAITLSPYFTISKAMGIIVFLSFLLHFARGRSGFPSAMKAMLVFMMWALLSLLWAESTLVGAIMAIPLVLNIGLTVILLSFIHDRKDFNLLMGSLFLGACVATALIVVGRVSYAAGVKRVILSEETSPVILADDLCLGLLAGVYLMLQKGFFKKIIIVGALPLILLAIFKTQSRTALGTAIIAPTVAFILSAKGKKRITYTLIAVGFVTMCAISLKIAFENDMLSSAAMARLRNTSFDIEKSGRTDVWRFSARLLMERPLNGWGWGNFPVKSPGSIGLAHNNIFNLAAELGIIGIILAAILYFLLIKSTFQLRLVPLRWIGITMLLYNLIIGMTATTYMQKDFWYSLAFAMVLCNIDETSQDESLLEPDNEYYTHQPGITSAGE